MTKEEELAELKDERRSILVWFASHTCKPNVWRAWTNRAHRLEEIHRRIDEITGERKFHR